MPRESQIPLFLWIATAILVHLIWGGGAEHAADQIEQTVDIGRFARSVRRHVRVTHQTLEVGTFDETTNELTEPTPSPDGELDKMEQEPEEETPEPVKADDEKQPKPTPPKPVEKKPEEPTPPEPKEEEKKEEEKKLEEKQKKEEEKKKQEEEERKLLPEPQRKVAVRQHVEDKNQKDNPDARFLGEHANRVKEETQARITSTEQNEAKPSPGGQHAGPDKNPGNSSETKIAQMEDREGDPDRPPSATSTEKDNAAPKPVAAVAPRTGAPEAPPQQTRVAPQEGQKAQAAVKAEEAVAPTLTAPGGNFTMPPQQRAVAEQKGQAARQRVLGRPPQDPTALLGLGAQGVTDRNINLNLTPSAANAVIGQKQLQAERARDGERRRSEHRGSWANSSFERFKTATENYVAGVKPGNTTALNTAHSPFANYLNAIHQRLHPIFADRYLTSLARLPGDHPLNDMEMYTNLEIVLSPNDGRIVKMGVIKPSGVSAFDIGALESVRKASPFGAAPSAIVSPDGNVYLHWGFYRKPDYACSTYNARPYMIKAKPKSVPPEVPPPAKPEEAEGRQGSLPVIDDAGENAVRTAKAD